MFTRARRMTEASEMHRSYIRRTKELILTFNSITIQFPVAAKRETSPSRILFLIDRSIEKPPNGIYGMCRRNDEEQSARGDSSLGGEHVSALRSSRRSLRHVSRRRLRSLHSDAKHQRVSSSFGGLRLFNCRAHVSARLPLSKILH